MTREYQETPALRLKELTDAEEIRETHENNYVEWGAGLTLEQYLEREKVFQSQEATKHDRLTYWGFQEQQPDGSWKTVCAMESLRRPAYFKAPGSPVVQTVCHSIGAVYTPAQNRGKGYATKMLSMGAKTLDDWQLDGLSDEQKQTTFSVLWSDIGDYYNKFGFYKTETKEIKFELAADTPHHEWPQDVQPVAYDDIRQLALQDQQQMKAVMDRDTENDGVTRVAIIPEAIVHHLCLERAMYLAPHLNKAGQKHAPHVFGAKHGRCWVLWTQDFTGGKLTALRAFADVAAPPSEVQQSFTKLFQAGLCEASKWHFPAFTMWCQDIPEQVDPQQLMDPFASTVKVRYHERQTSWPMVRYHRSGSSEQLKWVYASKYGWF